MKNPVSISNMRKPLRAVLLLAILLIASNLFISSISQFYIVNREIDHIGRYYRSAGYLVPSYFPWDENFELNPDYSNEEIDEMLNVRKVRELLAGDPMIEFENGIRQTVGLIDGLYKYRKDSSGRSYMLGENSFDLIFIAEIKEAYKSRSAQNIYEGSLLNTEVIDILGGVPDYIESDIYYKNHQEHHIGFLSHSIEDGEKFEYINNDVIDELYKLKQGKKYLFRTFNMMNKSGSIAKPLYEGGPLYIELDDSGEIDWDNPEFKIIKDEIDFINQNIISYQLIGTEDMTGMTQVQDGSKDYYLIDGRWIDHRDNENKNHVVVIHQLLAEMYELKIGDRLQIKMRDSERGWSLYTEKDKREWRTYYTSDPISFEIVGLYESNVFTGIHGTMYIPESTIPKELGRYTKGLDEPIHYIYYSLYNFVLKDPEDEAVFMEKYREPINELGFELRFVENNVNGFRESSAPMKRSSMISFILFTILLILIQGFVVYIYVEGNKLNYAIERALGIPDMVSSRHLIQPLIIFGVIASTIGGYIGYSTAVKKSTELLSTIPSSMERAVNSGLGIEYFVLFIILSMIPLIGILLLRTTQLKNMSVIDLINNNKRKRVRI